jgi:hypothetical protein
MIDSLERRRPEASPQRSRYTHGPRGQAAGRRHFYLSNLKT